MSISKIMLKVCIEKNKTKNTFWSFPSEQLNYEKKRLNNSHRILRENTAALNKESKPEQDVLEKCDTLEVAGVLCSSAGSGGLKNQPTNKDSTSQNPIRQNEVRFCEFVIDE